MSIRPDTDSAHSRVRRLASMVGLVIVATTATAGIESQSKSWTDAELVAGYKDLAGRGELDAAVRNPTRPHEPPQAAFLEALAWFAAQTPASAGTLTLAELDSFIATQVGAYIHLLKAKVEQGADNDYPRTRTWKVIQKLMLLRDEMTRAPQSGQYTYAALPKVSAANDPWEEAHTLTSQEEFVARVCKAPAGRTVLVKFGNTNCTQCMLFELTGSVKAYADAVAQRTPLDVYKVWFGFRPDSSFAGRIRDPKRLDALAKSEGVASSPYFIVYRDGRRYPCGDAFPDAKGGEAHLDACLAKAGSDAPLATVCAGAVE